MWNRLVTLVLLIAVAAWFGVGFVQQRLAAQRDAYPRDLVEEDARTGSSLSDRERQLVDELCLKGLDLTGTPSALRPATCACVEQKWERETARIDRFVMAAARTTPYGQSALQEIHWVRLDPSNEERLRRNADSIAERAMQSCRQP